MLTAAMSTTKTTPPQSICERRAHVADDVGLERQELRVVAGTDERVLERPGSLDDAHVLRVDPRLGARERDARRQPHHELVVLAVARAPRPAPPA